MRGTITNPDAFVEMGKVGAPYGLRGGLRVRPFTDHPESLAKYKYWWLGNSEQTKKFKLLKLVPSTKDLIATFEEIYDRTEAEKYRNHNVYIPRSHFPEAKEGEFYWVDLIGLAVVTLDGQVLGQLQGIFETGANQVMVVGENELLIPFIDNVVDKVDIKMGQILINWEVDF